jgi:hypothetical protein
MDNKNTPADPADQEQLVARHPRQEDPTRNDTGRTSGASTIANGGLAGGRPSGGAAVTPERARLEGNQPVMPDEEATLTPDPDA